MGERTVENTNSKTFAAIAAAIWAVALLLVFLSGRGSDVGQLGVLAGRISDGPLFGWEGFRDSTAGAVSALMIVLCCFGLGSFISSFIGARQNENHSHVLELAMKTAVGAAAWSLIWNFLGIAGLYTSLTASTSLLIGFLLAAFTFTRARAAVKESRVPERASVFDRVVLILIAIPVVLALLASLAPPIAKDTLLYHFSLPKAYLAQGGNGFIDGNIASYLPLNVEMLNVWAMLFGGIISNRAGEVAAGALNWSFLPLLLMVIYGWSREIGIPRAWALTAALMVAAVPAAYFVASSAYTDLALATFVTLALYAVCRWWKSLEKAWLIYLAIFLGGALSVKLTTIVVAAAILLVIIFRAKKAQDSADGNVGKIFAGGVAALVLALVIASPWYLRTWRATGSPVFPFYMNIWPGEAPGWDTERSNLFQAMNAQYGGVNKTAIDYLLAPWNLSVAAQPEQAEYFDGVLGVTFLIGLPVLIWALWKYEMPVETKIGVTVAGVMYLFWLFSSQQLRYLLPILPVLTIAIVAAAEKITERDKILRPTVQLSLVAGSAAALLVCFAWFLGTAPLRVVLGGESRGAYLTRNLDYYPYYRLLNDESPTDARVWLVNMRRDTYNLERQAVSDYLFEDWTLRRMVWESRNAAELKAKAAAMDVQYTLARIDFLFDYERSTLVDDNRPRNENESKLEIARELLTDPVRTVKADDKFSLVRVY